ncbi:hypothetical protein L1987_45317 [Smallanthus sonchifolius]|uniref:Uncharacterized protein n=1 Tax=Smallanthus sonchifolius TaxID=185202 RepID=A0ACB9GT89_9ASTR|nr:hypothetical protein L1987_45317 [Smallanthus sonchifolius]
MLREEVLKALATFGHKETHEELKNQFQIYINDRNTSVFPVDIRKLYREADAVQEKARILSKHLLEVGRRMGGLVTGIFFCYIASSPDPELVKEALDLMLTDEIREQDTMYVTARISLEGRETAWIWLKVFLIIVFCN